jgi:hypothetical protein
MSGEDVYDLRDYNWCYVCEEAHQPCETRDDGNAYYFEPSAVAPRERAKKWEPEHHDPTCARNPYLCIKCAMRVINAGRTL